MLNPLNLYLGTDPEIFFEDGSGRIVGAEKVIPKEGLRNNYYTQPMVVIDGIQAELHPSPVIPRSGIATGLQNCFNLLKEPLRAKKLRVNFAGVVEVERAELDSLSEASRLLGCLPSRNAYGMPPLNVNPLTYLKRSAGGHIHLGVQNTVLPILSQNGIVDERQRLVPMLDIFVGNTGVLLDRDLGAAERRKNYGRAGEFRLPPHGLEYRTLSNFWLRNSVLVDLMFGMASFVVSVLHHCITVKDIEEEELNDTVNLQDVVTAIQENDFNLAWQNFQVIRPFIEKWAGKGFPLNKATMPGFVRMVERVQVSGLEAVFPTDPFTHWTTEQPVGFGG